MYARLNVIQNGCPYKVKLIKTIKGSRLKERAIQKNFKKYNVMREWFIITDELLEFIKNPYFIPGERAKRKRKPTWLQGF